MDSTITIAQESRRVKQQLRDAGWTVGKLAIHLRVSQPHMSNLLRGHETTRWMQYEIARLMGREPDEFWGRLYWRVHQAAARTRPATARPVRRRRVS